MLYSELTLVRRGHFRVMRKRVPRISVAKLIGRLSLSAGLCSGSVIVILMVIIVVGVLCRYVLRQPLSFVLPLSQLFLVCVVSLGVAYTQLVGGHVRVDVIIERLPLIPRSVLEVLFSIIGVCFSFVLAWQTVILFGPAFQWDWRETSIVRIPIWPFYGILAFGIAILTLQYLVKMYDATRELVKVLKGAGRGIESVEK